MLKFEHRRQPLVSQATFFRRLARSAAFGSAIVLVSLALGSAGYHYSEGLPWLDSFLNASMILTGMGPVNLMVTPAGKLFSGCYALFSGVVFLTAMAVIFAPIVHRFLHHFNLECDEERESP